MNLNAEHIQGLAAKTGCKMFQEVTLQRLLDWTCWKALSIAHQETNEIYF